MKRTHCLILGTVLMLVLGLLLVPVISAQNNGNSQAAEFGAAQTVPSHSGGTLCLGGGDVVGIFHDDGTFENGYSGNPAVVTTFQNVDLFNPVGPTYEYTRYCVGLVSLGGPDLSFDIVFIDNDGTGGTPGTLLAAVPVSASNIPAGLPCAWYEYDLTGVAGLPTGADGDIYVGVRLNPATYPSRFTCSDETAATPLWTGYTQFNSDGWQATQTIFPGYRSMSHRVEMAEVAQPEIAISKTPDTQTVVSGGDANFTITVTNTGNVTLTNITVSDPAVPACDAALGTMGPGGSNSYACTDVGVTVGYTNTATVDSELVTGAPGPSASDDAVVNVMEVPDIAIDKSPDSQTVVTGGDASFTITVTNTGTVTLTNVTVSDPAVPDCDSSLGALGPASSSTYSCTDVGVTASYTNTATVTSELSTGGPGPTASADAVVNAVPPTDVAVTRFGADAPAGLWTIWLAAVALLVMVAAVLLRRRRPV